MPRVFTKEQAEEHNALFRKGCDLIQPSIFLDDRPLRPPGWFARRRLRKGIAHLHQALTINPDSWQSRFFIGKALQCLGDHDEALTEFTDAIRLAPENDSLALEAANEALEVGRFDLAAKLLRPALERKPNDPVLLHNSGVALVLAQRPQEAVELLTRAVSLGSNPYSSELLQIVELVVRGHLKCPRTMDELRRGA